MVLWGVYSSLNDIYHKDWEKCHLGVALKIFWHLPRQYWSKLTAVGGLTLQWAETTNSLIGSKHGQPGSGILTLLGGQVQNTQLGNLNSLKRGLREGHEEDAAARKAWREMAATRSPTQQPVKVWGRSQPWGQWEQQKLQRATGNGSQLPEAYTQLPTAEAAMSPAAKAVTSGGQETIPASSWDGF